MITVAWSRLELDATQHPVLHELQSGSYQTICGKWGGARAIAAAEIEDVTCNRCKLVRRGYGHTDR